MRNAYAHCRSSAHTRGYSGIFLVCSLQVHLLERQLVDAASRGWGSGNMTSNQMIPHMARLNRDLLFFGFLGPIHVQLSTAHIRTHSGLIAKSKGMLFEGFLCRPRKGD